MSRPLEIRETFPADARQHLVAIASLTSGATED